MIKFISLLTQQYLKEGENMSKTNNQDTLGNESILKLLIKFGTLKPTTIKVKMINVDIMNDFLLTISFIVNFTTVKISLIIIHLPFL